MIHEVRVFDGEGNLKEIIQPVFNYDPKPVKEFQEHKCKSSGCENMTKKKNYCSEACRKKSSRKRELRRRAEENSLKETLYCQLCNAVLKSPRRKYCSPACDKKAARAKWEKSNEKIKQILMEKKKEIKNAKH